MASDTADLEVRPHPTMGSLPHPVLDADSFGARSRDGGSVAELTVLQFALLHYLAYLAPGKVATWLDLARAMEPYNTEPLTARAIQWHVKNLRRRLSDRRCYLPPGGEPWPRELILTRRGRGLALNWSIHTVTRKARVTHTQDTRDAHHT